MTIWHQPKKFWIIFKVSPTQVRLPVSGYGLWNGWRRNLFFAQYTMPNKWKIKSKPNWIELHKYLLRAKWFFLWPIQIRNPIVKVKLARHKSITFLLTKMLFAIQNYLLLQFLLKRVPFFKFHVNSAIQVFWGADHEFDIHLFSFSQRMC